MGLSEFLISQEAILLDGAMGTQLARYGLEMGGQNNISNPEHVLDIHKHYSECGCHILITNTLTLNRIYIETHNVGVDVAEANLAGAKLAKSVAGTDRYVLGNMSSTGKMLEPYGEYSETDFYETFKEQATLLAEGGVDGFIVETMFDLREALCALRSCKDVASLPTIISMAFTTSENGGRTIMGNSAEECALSLTEAGAQAAGANCGDLDPSEMAEVVSTLYNTTGIPILAQPNAGKPRLIDDRTVFEMNPAQFATGIAECVRAGARLVGGCCGTSPEHIRAVAKVLTKDKRERT